MDVTADNRYRESYDLRMTETEKLRYARNLLLTLHKSLIDLERAGYENVHGKLNAGQFLNVLLEDENFAWLRKFSMLIVEIDEMFDLKDGISNEMVSTNLKKITELISMQDEDQSFRSKYRNALQADPEIAGTSAASGSSKLKTVYDRPLFFQSERNASRPCRSADVSRAAGSL